MRVVLASLCALCVVGSQAYADEQPSAVDAFVASANALAKAATESVDMGRATERLDLIRASLTAALVSAKSDPKIGLKLSTTAIICDVRANHVEIAARRNYLQAVAGRVQTVGTPSKIENLSSAIQSLFAGQSLDVSVGIPTLADLDSNRKKLKDRCIRDFSDFDRAYYGMDLVPTQATSAGAPAPISFSAVGALIDTIVAIVTPIVVEGAKIVDEERRSQAVLHFLEDETNVKQIKESGIELSKALSTFTWDKRLRLAGALNESAIVLRTSQIDLSKNDFCKSYLKAGSPISAGATIPSDNFVMCWKFAWSEIEPKASSLLKQAEEYDQVADVGDTNNALKAFDPLSRSLAAIKTTDANDLKKFWGWATRLIAFAQKVETGFSSENREKIAKQVDALLGKS